MVPPPPLSCSLSSSSSSSSSSTRDAKSYETALAAALMGLQPEITLTPAATTLASFVGTGASSLFRQGSLLTSHPHTFLRRPIDVAMTHFPTTAPPSLLTSAPTTTATTAASLLRRQQQQQQHEQALAALAAAAAAGLPIDLGSLTSPVRLPSTRLSSLGLIAEHQDRLKILSDNLHSPSRDSILASEAYNRGREEAILSLVNSGALDASHLENPTVAVATAAESTRTPATTRAGASAAAPLPPPTSPPSPPPADENDYALQKLGRSRNKNAPYFDASQLEDPDATTMANRRTRGGVTEPFPEKLHRMLQDVEDNGETDVISFLPHGRAFTIHHVERFCREIMPRYYKQSRLSSFQRQLNLYGFSRITSGPDAGAYYHELFLQGRPALAIHMRRVGVSQPDRSHSLKKSSRRTSDGIYERQQQQQRQEGQRFPDFYAMEPVKGAILKKNKNNNREEKDETRMQTPLNDLKPAAKKNPPGDL